MNVLTSIWLLILSLYHLIGLASELESAANGDIEVVLFFDQPNYTSGDTAHFAVHVFQKGKLISGKHIVRVGLWNDEGEEVVGMRMWLSDGYGADKLSLPPSIGPGVYTLGAYFEYGFAQAPMIPYTTNFVVSGQNYWNVTKDTRADFEKRSEGIPIEQDTFKIRQPVVSRIFNQPYDDADQSTYMISVYREDLFYPDRSVIHVLKASENVFLSDSAGKLEMPKFPAFFSGMIVNPRTKQVAPDSTRITFFLAQEDLVYPVYSTKDGRFSFPLFKAFDSQKIFYTITFKGEPLDGYEVKLSNPRIEGLLLQSGNVQAADPLHSFTKTRRSIEGSYQFFLNRASGKLADLERLSFDADVVVKLEKFAPFSSMEEMFSNVVPMVRVRKTGTQVGLRVFLKDDAQYAEHEPVYVIDGVMTRNTKYFMGLDPVLVERILVIRTNQKLARFGDLGKNGIVIVETKSGREYEENPAYTFSVSGVSKGLSHAVPVDQQVIVPQQFPDLRPVLYWYSGQLKDSPSITFTTSNATGAFVIEIAQVADGTVKVSKSRFFVSH